MWLWTVPWSHVGILYFIQFVLVSVSSQSFDIESLGRNLKLEYTVVEHSASPVGYRGRIILTNTGPDAILPQGWSIYFSHQSLIEPSVYNYVTKQYPPQVVVRDRNFVLQHVKGSMFRLQPYTGSNSSFLSLEPGQSTQINFMADQTAVSKYTIYPNWYLVDANNRTSLIQNTASNDRTFVTPSAIPSANMRSPADVPPVTPWIRYREPPIRLDVNEKGCVIPTPAFYSEEKRVTKIGDDWNIHVSAGAENEFTDLPKVKNLISSGLGVQSTTRNQNRPNIIGLYISRTSDPQPSNYTIRVEDNRIGIFAHTEESLFHGVQTLMSMRNQDGTIPIAIIQDEPRLPYRGFRIDVASNFFNMAAIKKIIDGMASYKMNKLKLCMADNEGWRIEIPEFPELTQIGSRRCHDEDEKTCLFSQFGSNPQGTALYFTANDYQEIVRYAGDRFIEVIPCINMAGKARAAIVAMEARSIARNAADEKLQDPRLIDYFAPDHLNPMHLMTYHDANLRQFDPRFVPTRYKNTGINPCLSFTFDFFETVLQRLINYHRLAGYDLETIDIGGDDTTYGAWHSSSPACQAKILQENSTDEIDKEMHLKVAYTTAIVSLADRNNVAISGLDDFFIAFPSHLDRRTGPSVPFNTSRYGIERDVYAVSAKNYLAYALRPSHLANAGYSVVLSPDDFFSFEHASEPDIDDFGDQSAIRYIDTFRVFTYLPDKRCCNYNPDPVVHQPLSPNGCLHPRHDFCQEVADDAEGDVVGMEAKISTDKIKDEDQLFGAIFPRLAAFAERAWHKAPWEDSYIPPSPQMITPLFNMEAQQADFQRFGRCLAAKELNRLDKMNIKYKIPPPGVRINITNVKYDTKLLTSAEYPGHFITQVKKHGVWQDLPIESNFDEFKDETELEFRTRNRDGTRFSRVIKVNMKEYKDSSFQLAAEHFAALGAERRMNNTGFPAGVSPPPLPMVPQPQPMMPPPGVNPMMFQTGFNPAMMPPGGVNPSMMPPVAINPAMMQGPGNPQGGFNPAMAGANQRAPVNSQQFGRGFPGIQTRQGIQGVQGGLAQPGQVAQGNVARQNVQVPRTQAVPNNGQTIQAFQGQVPNTANRQPLNNGPQLQGQSQLPGQFGANVGFVPNSVNSQIMSRQAVPVGNIRVQPNPNMNFRTMVNAG